MTKLSKRAKLIAEKIEPGKLYNIDAATQLLNDLSKVKFKESIDVAINLGVDAKKSDQAVRGATTLPHGSGKDVRVAVFTGGANVDAAKSAGADIVGMEDLADEVKKRNYEF
jgi:large subunit ribosomal protein L1